MSVTTARRLLIFDLAWCAFAAHGLLSLVDGLGAWWTRRIRAVSAAVIAGVIAVWSFTAVFALSAALPADQQHIPFGEAGFGDGLTCKRCLEAAKQWQRDVAAGGFVVMFDNDLVRENRTSPGGLPVYGKIAALAAGRPESFVEGYSVMRDWDGEAPRPGVLFDASERDFATYLGDRVARAAPRRIVWHFERPTLWERWLARRLVDAGGRLETFPTALSRTPGMRVVTPWERRDGAFAVLRELAVGWRPAEDSTCVRLAPDRSFSMTGPVLLLASAPGAGMTSPPEWLASSWGEVRFGIRRFVFDSTSGAAVPAGPTDPIELRGPFGRRVAVDQVSGRLMPLDAGSGGTAGLDCAVHANGRWWTLDPLVGRVTSAPPTSVKVPADAWIGVARAGGDELVLASAQQSILVFDPKTGQVVRRFPARVSPSVRAGTDECLQIAVGADWIATIALHTGIANFYDGEGRALGTKQLDAGKRSGDPMTAFAGAGHYLGIGTGSGVVRTFKVEIDPACGTSGQDAS